MQEYLCIGTITKPQGIRGEVKILPLTDDISRFLGLAKVFLKDGGEMAERKVELSRVDASFAYMKFEGIDNMDAAEPLRGLSIYVDRANAVKLPEGRWFIADLIGCRVVTDAGEDIGVLKDVLQAGGNDVYVVQGAKVGGKSLMFPAIKALLKKVDVKSGVIQVDGKRLWEVAVYED
ncbi:MAG: ribosome maturation factor RimM [Christensenellales bacterium]|jgi:16S rRNA processing protein RimM